MLHRFSDTQYKSKPPNPTSAPFLLIHHKCRAAVSAEVSWFRLTAEAVILKALIKHAQDLISHERGTKSFPEWTMEHWEGHHRPRPSPRPGRPSKIVGRWTRRKLIREPKRPTAAINEQQEYLAIACHALCVTISFCILHMSGLQGRMAGWKPFLIKTNQPTIQAQPNHPKPFGKNCSGWQTRTDHSVYHCTRCLTWKQDSSSPREHHSCNEAWWRQHHVIGLILFC